MAHIGCPACGNTISDTDTVCPRCQKNLAAARAEAVADAALTEQDLTRTMTEAQRQLFNAEMNQLRKEPGVGRILAFLLGGIGAQFFYLRSYAAGAVCVLFCWTWIPAIYGIIDLFLVGGRVRRYNIRQAQLVAARIRMMSQAVAIPTVPAAQGPAV